jgi:hypothetical protein
MCDEIGDDVDDSDCRHASSEFLVRICTNDIIHPAIKLTMVNRATTSIFLPE